MAPDDRRYRPLGTFDVAPGPTAPPLTLEAVQRVIADAAGTRRKRIAVVCPAAYPKVVEWEDWLRDACNIVEVRSSEYCPPDQMIVMLHPDETLLQTFPYPMRGQLRA